MNSFFRRDGLFCLFHPKKRIKKHASRRITSLNQSSFIGLDKIFEKEK